jgi:hypothetical protein
MKSGDMMMTLDEYEAGPAQAATGRLFSPSDGAEDKDARRLPGISQKPPSEP